MTSYKDPSFQDRVARASAAKRKALEQMRSKPALDATQLAERKAASLKRVTESARKAAATKSAKQALVHAATEAKAAVAPPPTEAERKAARDARYAARKNRK